jgi:hypothetical protein
VVPALVERAVCSDLEIADGSTRPHRTPPTAGAKWHAQTVIRLLRRIGKAAPHYAAAQVRRNLRTKLAKIKSPEIAPGGRRRWSIQARAPPLGKLG